MEEEDGDEGDEPTTDFVGLLCCEVTKPSDPTDGNIGGMDEVLGFGRCVEAMEKDSATFCFLDIGEIDGLVGGIPHVIPKPHAIGARAALDEEGEEDLEDDEGGGEKEGEAPATEEGEHVGSIGVGRVSKKPRY